MFQFFKNREVKKKQEGLIPFYAFPDAHKDHLVKSMELTLPIGFSNVKFFVLKAIGLANEVKLILDKDRLIVCEADESKLNLDRLPEGFVSQNQLGLYTMDYATIGDLAKKLDSFFRHYCNISNIKGADYYKFEFYWLNEEDLKMAEEKWSLSLDK